MGRPKKYSEEVLKNAAIECLYMNKIIGAPKKEACEYVCGKHKINEATMHIVLKELEPILENFFNKHPNISESQKIAEKIKR